MKNYGWIAVDLIGVDLDGTLAEYHGWKNDAEIGKPITLMVNRVKNWLKQGLMVKIFTARISVDAGKEETIKQIKAWCKQHIGQELEVTNVKDFTMMELWDDRARQVEKNTGKYISD